MFGAVIRFFTKKQLKEAFNKGYHTHYEHHRADFQKSKVFEIREFIGKKIIIVGNKNEDMAFGTGKDVAFVTVGKSPILLYRDAFTGEDRYAGGVVMEFSETTLTTLLKLTPFERWNMLTKCKMTAEWNKTTDKPLMSCGSIVHKLKRVGFL